MSLDSVSKLIYYSMKIEVQTRKLAAGCT